MGSRLVCPHNVLITVLSMSRCVCYSDHRSHRSVACARHSLPSGGRHAGQQRRRRGRQQEDQAPHLHQPPAAGAAHAGLQQGAEALQTTQGRAHGQNWTGHEGTVNPLRKRRFGDCHLLGCYRSLGDWSIIIITAKPQDIVLVGRCPYVHRYNMYKKTKVRICALYTAFSTHYLLWLLHEHCVHGQGSR